MAAIKHYAAHEHDKVPPAGKYNAGQKLFFWLQSLLGVVFVATGLLLWFPESFGSGLVNTMPTLPVNRLPKSTGTLEPFGNCLPTRRLKKSCGVLPPLPRLKPPPLRERLKISLRSRKNGRFSLN